MFGRREEVRKWLSEITQKFRQKGAISPDKALTAEELGLPPGFQEAMKRRLGRSGIFVEVDGKYYLNEARLKEIEELRRTEATGWGSQNRMFTLRLVRMILAVLAVGLLLTNLFVHSWELIVTAAIFVGVWFAVSVLQIYYIARMRRRFRASQTA